MIWDVGNEAWRDQLMQNISVAMCDFPNLPDDAWDRIAMLSATCGDADVVEVLDWAQRCRVSRQEVAQAIEQMSRNQGNPE